VEVSERRHSLLNRPDTTFSEFDRLIVIASESCVRPLVDCPNGDVWDECTCNALGEAIPEKRMTLRRNDIRLLSLLQGQSWLTECNEY
jgi:hypothetical protein